MTETLSQRAARLANPNVPKGTETASGKIDRRKFNKRHPNSGRKPALAPVVKVEPSKYEMVERVALEEVTIKERDIQTGESTERKMPRVVAMMRRVYQAGMSGDVSAMREFMSRSVGMPVQPIMHAFDKDKPLHISVDI